MPKVIVLTGRRYGRLVVGDRATNTGNQTAWHCRCDCGNSVVCRSSNLRSGNTTSCGCLAIEHLVARHAVHGGAARNRRTPEYIAWMSMKSRCYNTKHVGYANYGGRGVEVCERWRNSFESFFLDVGQRPSNKHSLDRYPNANGNYEPGNVRWATRREQSRNMRTNRMFIVNGIAMCMEDVAKHYGLSSATLYKRLNRGLTLEQAVR
jgi:hypothetical protein